MKQAWTSWLDTFAGHMGTVVHLGGGVAEALPFLEESSAKRIVLVTCDPDGIAEALRATHRDSRFELVRATLGAWTGEAEWRDLSLSGLSGLAAPTALFELFPGLTEAGRRTVQTRTLHDLLALLALERDPVQPNMLRIDLPGCEHLGVEQLIALTDLPFDHLSLRAQAIPLYDGAKPASVLLSKLKEEGFHLVEQLDADPDLPDFWLRRDPAFDELRRLRDELAAARELSSTIQAQMDSRLTQVAGDLEAERQKNEQMRQSTEEALGEARADATLALRMQALQAADLSALQRRYKALRAEKHEQDDLLRRVTARLAQAAEHVRQLDLTDVLPTLSPEASTTAPAVRSAPSTTYSGTGVSDKSRPSQSAGGKTRKKSARR